MRWLPVIGLLLVAQAAALAAADKTAAGIWAFKQDGKIVTYRELNADGTYYEANYRTLAEDNTVVLNNVYDISPPSYLWKQKGDVVTFHVRGEERVLATYTLAGGKLTDKQDGLVAERVAAADLPRKLLRPTYRVYQKGVSAMFNGQEVTPKDDLYEYSWGSAPDMAPDDPKQPLFTLLEAVYQPDKDDSEPGKEQHAHFNVDSSHPLLVVRTVQDAELAPDGKGVVLYLNAKDAKTFAALTRKYNGQFMALMATDKLGSLMHITGVVEDGYMSFVEPEKADLATYLRGRFHLGAAH